MTVHLNTELTAAQIQKLDADTVILAVGANPLMPKSIKGIDHPKAASCADVLDGINDTGAVLLDQDDGQIEAEADDVILSIGFRRRPSMRAELMVCGKKVFEIVAGNAISSVATQVSAAYEIARSL